MQVLSDGRFILGLGSGENLNEHVVGEGWPPVAQRQDMLEEAVHIIRALLTGDLVTWEGNWFRVDSARVWEAPDGGVPLGLAVGGEQAVTRFAPLGDHLIATEPNPALIQGWNEIRGGDAPRSRAIGQIPICWAPDKQQAIDLAHEQFRWFGGGWGVNADLPTPHGFAAASRFVRKEDVASSIACGPDLDELVEGVRPLWEAGFTDIALVQVGDVLQQRFLDEVAEPLLEKLRAAAPAD
jgi:G6PDH family F420-dependent oxidoreductase